MPDQFRTARPDWTDLRFLIELARQGSLSATARALGVTHATVARRIAALEEISGRPLFVRQNGRYMPTSIGAQIAGLARGMEEPALAITRAFAGVAPDVAGPVRMTSTDLVGSHMATPVVAELQKRHPGLEIELVSSNDNLSLARRDADIALRLGRPTSGDLFSRKLCDIEFYLYATQRYLRETAAKDRRYIGYCVGPPDLPEVQGLDRIATSEAITFRTNSLNVRLAAVRAGIGMALLPELLAEPSDTFVRVAPKPVVARELWLLVHRDMRDVPRIRICVDALVKAITSRRKRASAEGGA
jgi:DNA-binding transcriptional LysR family regulator